MPSRNRHRGVRRRLEGAPEVGSSTGTSATLRPPAALPQGVRRIASPDEAEGLAAHLLDPARDAHAIADAVQDLAEVVIGR